MYCIYCMRKIEESDKECPFCGKSQNMETPSHHLMPGSILNGRYIVGAAKGEGGFGITYIGRDKKLDRVVAIKEYYPSSLVNRNNTVSPKISEITSGKSSFAKGCERFLKEARILARFSDEQGIVNVIDFFEENNTAYIVMEYLDGKTLKDYIKEKGKISPEETLKILTPVMQSLEKIHKQGLIHRDISPSNIMLIDGKVKLIDFGAARNMSIGGDNKSISLMLKPGYAPEEQYRSKGEQGAWTDVYALCATMYKCITGITPDESNDRLHFDEIKTPSALGIDISPIVENAIMKGMSVLQKDRYQSIEELLDGLKGNNKVKANDNEETILSEGNSRDNENTVLLANTEDEKETEYVSENDVKTVLNRELPKNTPVYENKDKNESKSKSKSPEKENDIDKKVDEHLKKQKKKTTLTVCIVVALVIVAIGGVTAIFNRPTTGNTEKSGTSNSYQKTTESFYEINVTKSDIENLKGGSIRDISLRKCTVEQSAMDSLANLNGQITSLRIEDCSGFDDYGSISNITSLSHLEIKNCKINDNKLSKIDFSKLQGISYLDLSGNSDITKIDMIEPLSSRLTLLNINSTSVSDISVLSNFSDIEQFDARNCNISNIPAFKSTKLWTVELSNNHINDLSPLNDVSTIMYLDLSDNEIISLEPLSNCKELKSINVNRNKLTSLKGLENAIRLEKLNCTENEIASIDGIKNCTILREVNFNVNKISDISLLGKSSESLTNVYMNDNNISDLSCFTNAVKLHYLSFDNNNVESIAPIGNCVSLLAVSGENNKIQSISDLKNLVKLQYIYFPHNQISDISVMENILFEHKLYVLDLSGNNISKLKFGGIDCSYLSIYNNPLISVETLEKAKSKYLILPYIENVDWNELKGNFSYITITECPLDKQISLEKSIGKYVVSFSTNQETDEQIHKLKDSLISGKNSSTAESSES